MAQMAIVFSKDPEEDRPSYPDLRAELTETERRLTEIFTVAERMREAFKERGASFDGPWRKVWNLSKLK